MKNQLLNKYNFLDTGNSHILYQQEMEEFDLSFSALQKFAKAIKNGDLAQIKTMFQEVSPLQRKGLLKIELDYAVLDDLFEWGHPRTTAVNLAKHFHHTELEAYFSRFESLSVFHSYATLFAYADTSFSFEKTEQKKTEEQPSLNL